MWHDIALAVFGLLTGLSLGALGSGGSILALPAFVYAGGLPVKSAVATSLLVVGASSLLGAIAARVRCSRRGCPGQEVEPAVAVRFTAGGLVGSFVGARLSKLLPGELQMALFAIVAVIVAVQMAKGQDRCKSRPPRSPVRMPSEKVLLVVLGFGVGMLTGVVGVGGGFLIVPALTLVAGMHVKRAAATSLWVIAANSAAGMLGYVGHVPLALTPAAYFLLASLAGMLTGQRIAREARPAQLQRAFAVFVAVIGLGTLASTIMGRQ